MLTVGRGRTVRLAAALVPGLLAMGVVAGAGTAAAAGGVAPAAAGARAVLGPYVNYETATIHQGKGRRGPQKVPAMLVDLSIPDGGDLTAYCIDINRDTQPGARYEETTWAQSVLSGNADAGKVEWILQNSYPRVDDMALLAREAGVPTLSKLDAEAGTQVAIWTYSDHADVTADGHSAEKLAEYLVKAAAGENASEPGSSLSVVPTAVSGKSGTRVGPVTVHTGGSVAEVSLSNGTPAGVTVVDAAGDPVTAVNDGEQVFVDVPAGLAAGTATLEAQSTTTVPVGRVFNGTFHKKVVQTLILAGSSASTVSAAASVTWAPKGPIPAASATVDCAKSAVAVTTVDSGDQPFTYTLAGKRYTVAAGKSQTVLVPEREAAPYSITMTGDNGFSQTFTGTLDCQVATGTTTGGGGTSASGGSPAPAPAPSAASGGGTNLADTGASSATPLIAGIAVVLIVVGGVTVFLLRKRKGGPTG